MRANVEIERESERERERERMFLSRRVYKVLNFQGVINPTSFAPFHSRNRCVIPRRSVPYAAGNYTVVSFDKTGSKLGSFTSSSPGSATSLRAKVEWPGSARGGALHADRRDAAVVSVAVVDAVGTVVRGARTNVTFTVTGPGELLGVGNGDHMNHVRLGPPLCMAHTNAIAPTHLPWASFLLLGQ